MTGLIFQILHFKARELKILKKVKEIILKHISKGIKKYPPLLALEGVKINLIGLES